MHKTPTHCEIWRRIKYMQPYSCVSTKRLFPSLALPKLKASPFMGLRNMFCK
uniref:Uncharacterized protein n=1 Tax=Rhizophora mucronata TaxID=61149 RepID=A0A2P2K656_RHIMU